MFIVKSVGLLFQNFPAENLLKGDSFKKWKAKPGEKNASVIMQVVKSIMHIFHCCIELIEA